MHFEDEKRSLRPARTDKRTDHMDDSEGEIDSDAEDFHQACLLNSLAALKQYFYNRLEQTVLFLGGSQEHLKGWKVQVLKRTGGLTLGIVEVFYFSNRGKKFRSRVEVACFLNLMPSIKSIRTMSRDQFYLNAIETRERHLISQQLALCNFSCDEIIFHNDVITLVNNNIDKSVTLAPDSIPDILEAKDAVDSQQEATSEAPVIDFATAKNLYFSFGNMVILDWGRLVPDSAFHTNNQLYPLGFRCLRQEHDVALDRVVDCLCEIDAVFEGGDGASVLQMIRTQGSNLQVDSRRALLPLFRLSVAWHVGDEITIGTPAEQDHVQVRVYEARSPQQAWQAAMLEGLGINDDSLLTVRPVPVSEEPESDREDEENMTDGASGEEADDEELALRVKIREQRRAYFRVLRAEQSAGMQAAVRPRLSLDTVDSFAEELVMRLFEGMEGSINCRNYSFMDSRDREAGRKNMLKSYTKAFTKAKNLDRVIRKNVYLAEQIQQMEQKRRRVEDQESRKRAKIEDKEMRSLIISAQKSRTAKIREMEKNITLLKVAMAKTVKKRRDDAKLFAEILCDREEMLRFSRANGININSSNGLSASSSNGSAGDSGELETDEAVYAGPRPEPSESAIVLDGRVVGQLLEIWEYLNTFSQEIQLPVDKIPTVDQIMQAARVCDPAYKAVKEYTRSLERCFDRVIQHQAADPTEVQATQLMNTLGVYYCQSLMREFERVMGIDVAELQLGALRIPVNVLTWREIARVVLLNVCCRDLGVGDVDIAALLKGRGFFTTPESADRKVLKLARRRIKFNYVIRSELQESVYGFTSGLCVRLPAPGTPYIEGTVLWSDLIASLRDIPDSCGWLIFEVIKAAALSVCIIDTTAAAKKLKQALVRTLGLTSFRIDDGAATKAAALQILAEEERVQWRSTGGRWRKTVALNGGASSAISSSGFAADEEMDTADVASTVCRRLQLVYDETPYMIPPSTLHVWAKQLREAIRHADFGKATCAAVASALTASNLEDAEAERELGSAMEDDGEQDVADGSASNKEVEEKPACDIASIDDDTKQAEKLSIAMQRCYLVIRDLMMHAQANPFNWPVDFAVLPGYYKSIAQPLSLSEVRKFLVEGHYNDSIFAFYCDVMLVIENAMAYNQENSAVKLSAQKVLLVFERMFFETVLCWDNPLPFHDSCHACRSPHPIAISKAAVCDRCEGSYHLHCLDPPMHTPPRSEWYCIPCIEQKGVPTAHPYKTADVLHPTDPEARGEVVGMEQMRQTVMFVVQFGSVRELWDGQKVRKYALEPILEEAVLPKGTFVLKDDADANKGSLGFSSASSAVSSSEADVSAAAVEPAQSVYVMPSGYDYEDYDKVCGIARAYTGWGASHYLVPPVLMDEHNLAAQVRSKHDVKFSQFRESVAALGPASGGVLGDAMSATEWATVLSSLQHRVLDGSTLNAALAQKDDVVDDDLIAQIQEGVHSNSLPLEKVFGFVRGEGLIKTVKAVDPDAPVEPPRRGRKRRVDPNNPVPGAPLKTVTSVSSAVGEEGGVAGDEEDGEDEWDEDMDEIAPASAAKKAEEKKEKAPGSVKKGRGKSKKVIVDDDEEEEMFFHDEPVTPKARPSASTAKSTGENNADETDSADEDDLEFYDEHGNCLTSAVLDAASMRSPPAQAGSVKPSPASAAAGSEYVVGTDADPRCTASASPFVPGGGEEEAKPSGPETEEEWDLRLLSRQKGREDALLTHTLVLDTITQLDIDGSKEADEEIFKQVSKDDLGGDFYSTAVNAIVKSCLGRPSESLVAHEWTRGWEAKMSAMDKYLHDYTFQEKEILCPICGFEEGYLSSPFVWGQTNEEWEADVAADTAQDVLTEPEPPNDINAFPLAAGVSASTGIKGFRARYRVMKGLVWMPYNKEEAKVEEVECTAAKRPLKGGSLVMHECCANFMHFNRQMKQDKSRKMEDQRIVEAISGIGRAKCTPIGMDREGSFYWILCGCSALFVSTGGVETLREKAAQRTPPPAGRWSMYRNEAEISDVLCWLDPKIANERVLKKTLSILFPKAVTGEEEEAAAVVKPPPAAASVANAEPAQDTAIADSERKEESSTEAESMEVVEKEEEEVAAPPQIHAYEGGNLVSGDIMYQSGDEGESDDEAGADSGGCGKSSTTEAVDEEEEEEEVAVGTRSPLKRQCNSGADSSRSGMEVTTTSCTGKFSPAELLLAQQRKEAALATVAQRPAVSQRSQLLDIYAPTTDASDNSAVSSSLAGKAASFKYRKGEHVLVDASTHNHILWDARVLEMKSTKVKCGAPPDEHTEHILFYKVRFDRWGSGYDGWYEECQLISATATFSAVGRPRITGRELAQESKLKFLRQEIWTPPAVLQTLLAYKFMNETGRACGTRPRMTFSDCESAISQLRTAMLMVEAALPYGAIDDSDDRWGEDFVVPWREAVAVASDAISLMQCQLMLEYGIRTSWLKPAGLKMFSCLPSRVQCARNATCGLVAIRVWVLDMTIKYEQIKKDDKAVSSGSGKGRPPKSGSAVAGKGSGSSGGSKKAKKFY